MIVGRSVAAACVLAVAWALPCAGAGDPQDEEPQSSGLVETAERRLVQLDVTVEGPPEVVTALTREDFKLKVGLLKVPDFVVDNLCVLPAGSPGAGAPAPEGGPTETAVSRPATSFLFYFDQHHLTMAGRARAIDIAQVLIPELIDAGNQVMIVSAGQELRTFSELTGDAEALGRAMRELNEDRRQWEPWVELETERIAEILEILEDESDTVGRAIQVARRHQREERWRTEKALHLFSLVLGHLAEVEPPKVVLYFADTMRKNAGDHYLSFFSRLKPELRPDAESAAGLTEAFTFSAEHAFDRALEEATAMGIRVYTIEARGVTSPPDRSIANDRAMGYASPAWNARAVKDSQSAMSALALESGGRAFLNGVRARRIGERILQDLSCVYVLSFDASNLEDDTTHRVVVKSRRDDVKLHARGQITVQSESRRLTSRLMAAFVSPQTLDSRVPVDSIVIPTGFSKGRYTALVQIQVPGSRLPTASWDLGLSLVSRGEVAEDVSGRVSVSGPGVPVVLEKEMTFAPGPFKLVGVALERTGNDVGTDEMESEWPDPDEAEITLGPVAVLQPTAALILRDEVLRHRGAVGVPEDGLARTDRSTVLVGIVCRAKGSKRKLRVERKLSGDADSFAPFGPFLMEFGDDRCVQIRDLIPAGSMSAGMFSYEVRVLDDQQELASTVRRFAAVSPVEPEGPTGPPGPATRSERSRAARRRS